MVEPAWARERLRLVRWAVEDVPAWTARLRKALGAGDIAEMEECLAWFDANGVDATEEY